MRHSTRWLFALVLTLLSGAERRLGAQDDKVLRVFVFAGQSNMVGADSRAKDIEQFPPFAGLDQPQPKVLFSYCLGREDKRRSDGWEELKPIEGMVGPELSFAREVTADLKAPIAIIKIAAGGTHLFGDWNPDEPTGFKLYPLALDHVRAALADLDRKRIRHRLEGFVWHQGENDMFEAKGKANYAANLTNFIKSWRRDLKAPELRFFVGELCSNTVWGMDNRANMHAIEVAQRAVAEADPLVDYVPTSHQGVEIGGGAGLHYHYGTLGQLEHGVSHAQAYLRSIGKAPRASRPLANWPYPKGKPVKLFVFAGHRNMEGERAFVQDLAKLQRTDLRKDNPAIAFRYRLGGGYKVSEGWEPLGPAGSHDTFGPELSFARRIVSKQRDHVAIVKFTHAGSQIVDWTPAGSEAPTRNLYPAFVAFVRDAVKDLTERGHPVELAGIFYHLGENDMCFGPYRREAAARLASIVAQSGVELEQPELRWFVTQQRPPEDEGLGRLDVSAELAKVAAADPRLRLIQAFDLPGRQKLVFTTAGILALGELLADRYLDTK
jgi:hypothetical protein